MKKSFIALKIRLIIRAQAVMGLHMSFLNSFEKIWVYIY